MNRAVKVLLQRVHLDVRGLIIAQASFGLS